MSELKDRVFYGCQQHAPEWRYGCDGCLISAVGRLADEVERLDTQWEERLNENFKGYTPRAVFFDEFNRSPEAEKWNGDNFDIESNSYSVRGELGTLADLISPRTDLPSVITCRPDASSTTSDRGVGEREDSVGRRRRRQEFDRLGILHEKGSD